ncbi:MAG: histidine phosphatase family protein [Huintestinicola sp.]
MKIYSTRHGETKWNSQNIICGVTDVMLTEKGIKQARELAEKIKQEDLGITRIICSPLKRALITASFTASALGVPMQTDKRLTEWNYGSFEGKHRDAEGFLDAKLEFGCPMPDGGESVFDLVSRVYGLIDEIREKYPDDNVLLVCHGGVCRVIEAYFNGMTRERFANFFMGNCELREYEI